MPSVFVTGASRGIGRIVALEFARRGYRVVATARDPGALAGLDVDQKLQLDVTDQETVDSAVSAAGEIDILVSNAGAPIIWGAVEATPPEALELLYAHNTSGTIRVVQAVLPQMRRRRSGRLLFVSGVLGRVVRPGSSGYAATKWALEALVEALATEVRHWGIRATLLQPNTVSSGALHNARTYSMRDDPYAGLFAQLGINPATMLSAREVGVAIADAAELDDPPLRLPIGDRARAILAAHRAAVTDSPFLPIHLDW
ncbi:SDR family NAD(P)-dependent oxidoreductase [Amycolatopsis sp. GM8]|uniref:SDR family NAD(P)-dependent oxidoreductase n=1 Tax=Amycolatopsis sp. GM8 TaxID=2896530 RepID=UPI001F43309C|nr:SDR family NAD(P)-dependent oxidoreductase [Amycolatopsis sp. GM8]